MASPLNKYLFKGVQLLLFSFLAVYILLRVLYTDTLHDEVATYMFYFYQGDFIGEHIQWDANNHLLNSFIGHQLYKIFGDNFAILRLPNFFAFILYFWGTVQLVKNFSTESLKSLGLIALNTIPFILEYFGNARGYGLSMGLFAWTLVFLIRYLSCHGSWNLFLLYASLGLAVSANLTLVLSSLMIFGIVLIAPFISDVIRSKRERIISWVYHAIFIAGIIPLILFGLALKKGGALYYGSLDGLWEVTGKTLNRYVFFYDADWLQYLYLLVFAGIITVVISVLRKKRFPEWVKQPLFIYSLLFFGNLIAILLLAHLFEVNYPEDRAGMYLVLLFLLILMHIYERYAIGKFLQWGFLFFPITLIAHLTLETSVFSPDDRLDREFYSTVKKEIEPEHSLMLYHIMNWNWPYAESHSKEKASVGQFDNPNTTLSDIIVTKTTILDNPEISLLYDTIDYHAPSTYIAFKRKQPLTRVFMDSTSLVSQATDAEYVDIANIQLDGDGHKDFQISVSGFLKTYHPRNKIQLIVQSEREDGSMGRYFYYSFETTYQSQLINNDFLHHFIIENLDPQEKQIKVYLWNRSHHALDLRNSSCVITELKSPENESR